MIELLHTSLLMSGPFSTPIFLNVGLDMVDHKHCYLGHLFKILYIAF